MVFQTLVDLFPLVHFRWFTLRHCALSSSISPPIIESAIASWIGGFSTLRLSTPTPTSLLTNYLPSPRPPASVGGVTSLRLSSSTPNTSRLLQKSALFYKQASPSSQPPHSHVSSSSSSSSSLSSPFPQCIACGLQFSFLRGFLFCSVWAQGR